MKKRIIVLFTAAIILCLLPCVAANADRGEYNDLYWYTSDEEGCVYITGCSNSDVESLFIPSEINGLPVKGITFFDAFSHYENLKSVTIAEGVETVAAGDFGYCPLLKTVNLPSSLTQIGGGAFQYCESLESITIPKNTSYIGPWSFVGAPNLKIYVDPRNPYFQEKDNVIIYKEPGLCTLVMYSPGKTDKNYSMPEGIDQIESGAFMENKHIENFVISKGVKRIYGSFGGCSSLKTVTVPSSTEIIRSSTFSGCDSLTDIYYEGSEEEWNKILIAWEDEDSSHKTPIPELPDYVDLISDNVTVHFAESTSEPCFEVLNGDVTNTSDSEEKAVVIIANYNNQNALQTVSSQEVAFAAGETRKFNVSGNYRIFVWNSLSGMKSLVK